MTTRLMVRLTPRGGRDAVEGWVLDSDKRPVLKVRVGAPPVEGSANAALIRILAAALRLPARQIRIEAGAQSRVKRVEIEGLEPAMIEAAFGSPDSA